MSTNFAELTLVVWSAPYILREVPAERQLEDVGVAVRKSSSGGMRGENGITRISERYTYKLTFLKAEMITVHKNIIHHILYQCR